MANLSSKELSYLKDLMSWELLAAKKSYSYAQQETNPARQQLFNDAAGVHQQNYLNLLTFTDQFAQQGGQMS